MKHIFIIFAAATLFSCNDISNGGDQTNSDSAGKFDNPHGEPAGGGVYSTDSTARNNVEPTLQGGSKGTGNDIKQNDTSKSGYNNDTSNRIMNPGPGGDTKRSNPDSAKKAGQKQ